MLNRRRHIAAKIESEAGTAESLAAADAKIIAYNPKITPAVDMFQRNPYFASLGKIGQIPGNRAFGLTFNTPIQGAGDKETETEWSKLLKACGHQLSVLYTINIGAVTSGPFVHGEIVTGGTSSATGRVIVNTADGASAVLYVAVSGTLESGEVLTGGTSGATATTSSAPAVAGKVYESYSTTESVSTLTMASYEDGLVKKLKGARGQAKLVFNAGQPAVMEFSFMGVEAGVTDSALLTQAYDSDLPVPPAFLSASLAVGSYAAKISQMEIDLGITLAPDIDVNQARGIDLFIITDRNPQGNFDPKAVLEATHTFYANWFAGTESTLSFNIGATTGNKYRFYAPRAQYTSISDEDREGIVTNRTAFVLNDSLTLPDTDYCLLQL